MPTKEYTAAVGDNFDGTPGQGEVLFDGLNISDETQRATLYTIAVVSGETQTNIRFVLAKTLADANGAGPNVELANMDEVTGLYQACCECLVPKNYNLYVFTTGGVTTEKYLVVDWRRTTMTGYR